MSSGAGGPAAPLALALAVVRRPSDPPFSARQPGRRRPQRERLPGLGVGGPLQWGAGAARQSSTSHPAAAASSMARPRALKLERALEVPRATSAAAISHTRSRCRSTMPSASASRSLMSGLITLLTTSVPSTLSRLDQLMLRVRGSCFSIHCDASLLVTSQCRAAARSAENVCAADTPR
jgi:hypothetical protein